VVVRINDRGPFHSGRIVDVSYTAALKLGLLGKGSHTVELERLLPGDPARAAVRRNAPLAEAQAGAPAPRHPAGYYLQLGAYSHADRAADMRALLLASGVVELVEVMQAGLVHRLYGGPFGSRDDALAAARALPASLGIKPIVVRRSAD
jgi:rare lipoprotein A